MPPKLRYEIYLPTLYNNKKPIDASKYRYVKNKLLKRCRSYSIHPATVQGTWVDEDTNIVYFDNCFRFEITVDKNPENELFFEDFKIELLQLFKQHQIYMICTEVNWI
jgi:hypothetical protein